MNNLSLKDLSTKIAVVDYHNEGKKISEIVRLTGIPSQTLSDFLLKKSHSKFWEWYDTMEEEGGICVGLPLSKRTPESYPYEELNRTWKDPALHYDPEDVSFINGQNGSVTIVESIHDDLVRIPPEYTSAGISFEDKVAYATYKRSIQRLHEARERGVKILVIADTQCKPDENLEYMTWIGKYIADKKPDIVVHIGDHFDFPSLSSYDKGKKSFEGRRLKADIEAGNLGMQLLMEGFKDVDGYTPRLVFCMGNHEYRFDRLAEDMPELDGFVGTDTLPLREYGWEVVPFLKPIEIAGIFFVHYLANPFTGKPYGGSAMSQLKTVGNSFVVGHKQCLDVAIRPTLDGKHQLGIINGAAYPFEESYKGYQGNNHWRGLTMLHEAKEGFASPMFVSLDYLKGRYGSF